MRIRHGRQSGGSLYGRSAQEDRTAMFRRKYRVGQRLSGTLVRWVKDGLAWVRVEGQELVAELHSSPSEGATLYFIVDQLDPQIVLREIRPDEPHVLPADPLYLLRYYREHRDLLDTLLHDALWLPDSAAVNASEPERERLFCEFVAGREKALNAFTEMTRALLAINKILAQRGKGLVRYQPWRLPAARAVELHVQADGEAVKATLGAAFEDGTNCLVRLIPVHAQEETHGATLACRVFTDSYPFGMGVKKQGEKLEREAQQGAKIPYVLLGVSPLPEGVYDILGPLLTDSTHHSTGLNLRA